MLVLSKAGFWSTFDVWPSCFGDPIKGSQHDALMFENTCGLVIEKFLVLPDLNNFRDGNSTCVLPPEIHWARDHALRLIYLIQIVSSYILSWRCWGLVECKGWALILLVSWFQACSMSLRFNGSPTFQVQSRFEGAIRRLAAQCQSSRNVGGLQKSGLKVSETC